MSRRTRRVEDLLRSELAELIRRQISDPRVGLTTVVGVDVSPDLRHARVRVSVIGEEHERIKTVEALQHARGFLRTRLARRLSSLRVTPELVFELDRGAEYSERISQLLENLHEHDEST